MPQSRVDRRRFIQLAAGGSAAMSFPSLAALEQRGILTRTIPGTGESLPAVGLGTSHEFNQVPPEGLEQLQQVLAVLMDAGGRVVDTAPRYGNAEALLGGLFSRMNLQDKLFIATKISLQGMGTGLRERGRKQLMESPGLLGKDPLDLTYVHSLSDLEVQWRNLMDWKSKGRVRYIGVTVWRYDNFDRLERFIRNTPGLDFVQLNYSPMEPRAGDVLIPLAADRGIAVVVNRPFGNGGYFTRVGNRALPEWTQEFDCESWAQFSLKWILANENVTCVIPATSNPKHMLDNARAGYGRLPDKQQRRRMVEYMRNV